MIHGTKTEMIEEEMVAILLKMIGIDFIPIFDKFFV